MKLKVPSALKSPKWTAVIKRNPRRLLKPLRITVTAGPTREFIDPVRFISNRSSGKMGYAIARAAARRHHHVTLISGPVTLPPPAQVTIEHVVSADSMRRAVSRRLAHTDILIMVAAVSDWKPKACVKKKIKKTLFPNVLPLQPTPDILLTLRPRKGRRMFVGFAAETGAPDREAWRKLLAKGLDMIVANDVSRPDSGFEVDTNRVSIFTADGIRFDWPVMSKASVARKLVDLILTRWQARMRIS